ncbi:hypothetical protein [Streptococcus suis]|uniref:Uncharacterized protein n=1 Tax=Streptococcus suis TaxID=1307 RepID=A0A0Z8G8T5_STRSU|nr:hypothetical protein [Streptococcus suis]MDD7565035.1 hypothetical protein [Streptococcus suis]MDY5055693.1 hypothetical protein [Streptococcus suis]NQH51948.1 hypothetical protein [Streptococcus suis]NQP66535.1 hypothetical protein [Streptococcus suis]NQR92533.1 hypothetical protein [Streptococcus suis]
MNELLEKLKSLNSDKDYTIETDELSIKNNTILTRNNCIQINNISMLYKSELQSPVTLMDYIILIALFFISLIPPFIGVLLLTLYGFIVYSKYKKHLKDKYYIIFNLGSSQNYYLFFKNSQFRNQVFNAVTKSFDSSLQNNFLIDIKNEKIENQTVFKSGSTQTNVSGDNNVLGNNNTTAHNGDAISNSNIINNSKNVDTNINDIPWDDISLSLQNIISENQYILSEGILSVFTQLLEASKEKNNDKFQDTVSKNQSLLNNSMIKDIIAGTMAGLLTNFLIH